MRSSFARRLAAGVLLLGLGVGPALADGAGQAVTLYDERGKAVGFGSNPFAAADPNNAAFWDPRTPFTVGGSRCRGRVAPPPRSARRPEPSSTPSPTAGRCRWPLVVGGQILPFAVTGASSGPACTYTNLN